MTGIKKLNKRLEEKGLNQKYNIVYEDLFWSLKDKNGTQIYGDNNEKNVLAFIDRMENFQNTIAKLNKEAKVDAYNNLLEDKAENSVTIILNNKDYFVVTPMSTDREDALSEVNNWVNTYKEYLNGHIKKISLLSELTIPEIENLNFTEVKDITEEYAKRKLKPQPDEKPVVEKSSTISTSKLSPIK